MPDTLASPRGVHTDTHARYRLRRSAVEKAKQRRRLPTDEAVWTAMGVSRSTFYRLLAGFTEDCPCKAATVAQSLGLTVEAAFERSHP